MLVKDIMSTNVIQVDKNTSLYEALNIMLTNNIRRLLVNSEGIITIRDIVYNWKNINSKVEDIMNTDLKFIDKNASLLEACRVLTASGIGSLIVGNGEKIEGIVTERDLIRYCKVDSNSNVGDIMNVDPLLASEDASLDEIIDFMKQKNIRHATVVRNNLPYGVISVRDIGKAILAKRNLNKTKVEGFMTYNVYKVTPDSTIETARYLMAEKNIGYLPVVDSRSILGSISERELLAVLSI
ncbi:CBS domain-containing protein [Acidianus sulfidivorans JP7]|uniref:Histidine kinase n=1 Tax=Acidianus sulfidivorans JP7 TaxID=619593 RepID=A0A2U9IN08_9CREN|nr:CBS domain-containing protein [Acidianus sulfidivorans]AWR97396.1 CBS domain-containing protein [Acidianus sulfidivorans JP7]